ncbi:hypothetical protein [Planomonospora algeriensis]
MLGLLSGALVVLSSGTASANNAELVVDYACTGGIGKSGPVNLRTKVSIPTTLAVGEPLAIGWTIDYLDGTRFGSPDFFASQGKVTVTGDVQLSGGWYGVLKPTGSLDQSGPLRPDSPLELPEGISDSAHTTRATKVKVTPQALVVDFTPPAGEVMVNDDDSRVLYETGTWRDLNDQPEHHNNHHQDIHRARDKDATASLEFTGTGIEYVAQRDFRAGRARFYLDGKETTPAYVDASKEDDGTSTSFANKGGLTLWSLRGLDYGKHRLQVVNDEQDKWTQLDAFRVITEELASPPLAYRATCTLVSAPVSVDVTIGGAPSGTPDPTGTISPTPTGTGSTPRPTVTNSGTWPLPTCTSTPTPTPTPTAIPSSTPTAPKPSPTCTNPPAGGGSTPTPTNKSASPTVTVTAKTTTTPKPTVTATVTVTPTRATPTTPQVVVTPQGGADTGGGPGEPSGLGLVGAGSAVVFGGMLGGVALVRRRAGHARGGE